MPDIEGVVAGALWVLSIIGLAYKNLRDNGRSANDILNVRKLIQEQADSIASLKTGLNQRDGKIKELEERINAAKKREDELKAVVDSLEKKVIEWAEAHRRATDKLEEQELAITNQSSTIDSLQKEKERLEAERDKWKESYETALTAQGALAKQVVESIARLQKEGQIQEES